MEKRKKFYEWVPEKDARILEIGPLNNPIFLKSDYPNARYGDIRSTEEVKRLYSANEYLSHTGISVNKDTIVDIDYVLDRDYAKTFSAEEKFDVFVASHVIEHMPDIVYFFQNLTSVLKEGSRILIAYPDRRYCFDHFRAATSFRDAYDVYRTGSSATARLAFDFLLNVVSENDPAVFWKGVGLQKLLPADGFAEARDMYDEVRRGGRMDDVHYWIFSDYEFLLFMQQMMRANLFPYRCTGFIPTQVDTQEFYVQLQYCPDFAGEAAAELQNMASLLSDCFSVSCADAENTAMRAVQIGKQKELQDEIDRLQRQLADLKIQLQGMKELSAQLQNSRSWKLTSPIRKLLEQFDGERK